MSPRRSPVDPQNNPERSELTFLNQSGKIWTAEELLAAVLPKPREAIPGLLPEGLTVLAGRPKKGKSWLALSLSIATSRATPALGFFPILHARPVLFIGLEDGPRRLQDRMRLLLGDASAPPNLHIATDWPQLGQGAEALIEWWLNDNPDAALVVIDTYQKLRPPVGRGEDRYALDYHHVGALKDLADRHHVALLLLHHTRKPIGGDDPLDEVLGSTGLTGAADAVLVLRSEVGKADAVLYLRGRDLPEAEHALTHDRETGRWSRLGEAAEVRRSPERDLILAVLAAKQSTGMKPKEIAVATAKSGGRHTATPLEDA